MCLESKPRGNCIVDAKSIIDSGILVSNGELGADLEAFVAWYDTHVPSSKAGWIPIVLALILIGCAVEITVKIHLLSRVVFVYIFALPDDIVNAILDAVYSSSDWLFADSDGVSQSPPQQQPAALVIVG